MAKLTFTLNELLELVLANGKLPEQLSDVRAEGSGICFTIKIPAFLLPSMPASIKFKEFDNGKAVLEAEILNEQINNTIGKFSGMLGNKLPSFISLEYPQIYVNIDKMLIEKNIKGFTIQDVAFEDGEFTIITDKKS